MTDQMPELTKRDDVFPICPHCEKALYEIWYREIKTGWGMGRRFVYFCSSCHKTIGVSHRKGFWMG